MKTTLLLSAALTAFAILTPTHAHASELELRAMSFSFYQLSGGIELSPRTHLMLGVAADFQSFSTEFRSNVRSTLRVDVPISIKVYLQDPRSGALVPSLRFGVSGMWQRFALEDEAIDQLGVSAETLVGAWYFPTEKIAIGLEGGLGVFHGMPSHYGLGGLSAGLAIQDETSLYTRVGLNFALRLGASAEPAVDEPVEPLL